MAKFLSVLGGAARSSCLRALFLCLPLAAHAGVDLVVNNSDNPDPVAAGGTVTYTIRVNNDSNTGTQATGVTASHAVAATATYQGSSGAGVTCTGMAIGQAGPGTVTCALPDLAADGEVGYTIQLRSTAAGNISLGATATSAQADDQPGNNTLNQITTVNAGANVAMLLTPASGTAASGSAYSWALAVSNAGPDPAVSLTVTMPVPVGFAVGSVPPGCTNSSGTISCNVPGPIAPGGTAALGNVTGRIVTAGGSTVTGSASVAVSSSAPIGAPRDPDTGDNTAVASINVTPGSDLTVGKTRSVPGNLIVGQSFNFVLTPRYTGGSPSAITLSDTLPSNYTIGAVAASQNGWTCSVSGQTVTCTRPTGGSAGADQALGTVTIPVTVASAGSAVVNSATVGSATFDPDTGNNTANDGGVNLLAPTVNLGVSKTGPNPALVVAGVPFDYVVRASNSGNSPYFGTFTVTDSLPAGLTVNSYTLNGWSCTPAAPVAGPAAIACTRTYTSGSPLAAGADTPAVVLNTTAGTTGTLDNSVSISATTCNLGAGSCGDGDTANYSVTSNISADAADVRAVKTASGTVFAGDVLTYTLEVVNTGPSPSANVVLTDILDNLIDNTVGPSNAGYVGHAIAPGLATGTSCTTAPSGGNARTLTCNFATIPVCVQGSGNCPVVTVRVRPGGNGGTRTNIANAVSNGTSDPDHANDAATVSSTITPRADVTVAKTAQPGSIAAGQNLTYVVTATNIANNLSAADNVTITDTLPLNVTFVSATPSAGSCGIQPAADSSTAAGNRTVTCNLGTINNGAQRTVTIVVRPNTATRGSVLANAVSVSTSTIETDSTNNTATATATVTNPSLDLVLNKVDTVDPVAVGDLTAYTITVTNSGPSAAEDVAVSDPLPGAGLSFESLISPPGAVCTTPAVGTLGGTVSCTLGTMAPGATRTLTVGMRGAAKGVYNNTATVTSTEIAAGFDTNATNNSATETTTVRTKVDLEVVSKTATPAAVDLRDDFTFLVRIRNNTGTGLGEADDVVFTDNLPAGMELTGTPTVNVVSGTTTATSCTGGAGATGFTCSLGTVSSGAQVEISIPAQVVAVTSKPQVFTNTASVGTASSTDVNPGNNSNTGTVTVGSSTLSGRVFRDFNNDGLQTAGDTGIAGIVMTLTGTAFDGASVTRTATTDANGNYTILGIPLGTSYVLTQGPVAEANLNDGIDTPGSLGGSAAVNDRISGISIPANVAGTGYDFAEVPVVRAGIAKAVQVAPAVAADGTFTATFRLRVSNPSLEALSDVAVTDSLSGGAPAFGTFVPGGAAATLANGQYTLQAAPAGTCAGLNAGFDGSATTRAATIPSLAAGASCQIDLTLRVRPTSPLPPVNACGGRYCNQASVSGTGALSGGVATDLSDNGTNPDPNGNGRPDEAGENDPTPLTPTYGPQIAIAKSLNGAASVQADFSVLAPMRLVVTNAGNEPLSAVNVSDALSGAAGGPFGTFVPGGAGASLAAGQYTVQVAPAFSGACSGGTASASFTGHAGATTVATVSSLAPAASCTVDFSLRFMPLAATSYTNQATAAGTSDFTATPVNASDSEGVPYPRIGIAKRVAGSSAPQADGTVIVPFSLVVRNLGGEALGAVTVTDSVAGAAPAFGAFVAGGAAATLAAGQYTVQTPPAFDGACTGGSANAGFTGAGTNQVAAVSNLAVDASCTVAFALRFRPVTPQPPVSAVCGERYCNQAAASGTGAASGLATNDISDNGTVPDADGDGLANEAGENDSTPVPVAFTPRIGMAKSKPVAEAVNANGTVTATFRVRVRNHGNEPLTGVSVTDTAAGASPRFGTFVPGGAAATLANGQYTIESAPVVSGACPAATLTAGFTGSGASTQLASLTRLEVGEACDFDFALRFKPTSPLPAGGYSNQANSAGTGEFSGSAVNDLSNNGTNPDPNGNGDPTDDNAPTPVSASYTPAVGIAKTLQSGLLAASNGSFTGTFRLLVRNLGNEELNNVVVTDLLAGAAPRFGTYVAGGAGALLAAGQYTVQSAPAFVGACTGGTSNAGFDGSGTTAAATIAQLAIGASCTLEFGVRFAPQPGAVYSNQALASGTGAFSGNAANDSSDDGTNPDANNNGNGNEPGENDPTPVPVPGIGIAKAAGAVTNHGDGTYSVPFTLTIRNTGQTPLASVQVTDTVAGQFGTYTAGTPAAGQYTISSGPVVAAPANGAALTAVASGVFTGSGGGTALLVPAGSALPNTGAAASSAQLQFTVRFFPTTPGPFANTAIAAGTSPAGGSVSDDSVDGTVPDANGNGDPKDDTSPTQVTLSGQAIGIAKAVGAVVQTGTKKFRVPYTLVVRNVSTTVTATNVQATDSLVAAFPTAQTRSVVGPAAVLACTGTVLAPATPAFDGVGQNNLLAGAQALQPGESCTIQFTAEVDFGTNPLPAVVQNNQAFASTAQTPGGIRIASDASDNGLVPDANGNGDAGEAGENDPTPVSFAAAGLSAVNGKVYLDRNHDRADNDGPASASAAGFIVEVLNAAGQVVGTAVTAPDGTYTVAGLFPSTAADPSTFYTVQFREPATRAIYGISQSSDPDPARNGVVANGRITQLQLAAGVTTTNQNLPLDPSGVVYDAVTRAPIAGATVTLLSGGAAVPAHCLVGGINAQVTGATGMYQFLLLNPAPAGCPGTGTYTVGVTQPAGYLPPASTLIPPSAGPRVPPAGGVDAIQAQSGPPTGSQPTTYFFSFNLTPGVSADVVNNHIPLDPILGGAIAMSKVTPLVNVARGDLVPYTITGTNTLSATLANIEVVDRIPPGFRYRTGSATLNGLPSEPQVEGRALRWPDLTFAPGERKTWRMLLVVGSGVGEGTYVNQVAARNSVAGAQVSNTAEATVRVVPDPTFDCSDIIGKVFDDRNANGYQDEGEPGIPNVRIATARGLLVTSDAHGRFHVACADIPNADRGSNFVMKLDERTLPTGYRLTTENPRDVRTTRGKLVKLNFGAAVHRVVRLEVSAAAFASQGTALLPAFAAQLEQLPSRLSGRPSVLRIAYRQSADEPDAQAQDRVRALVDKVQELWRSRRPPPGEDAEPVQPLQIETEVGVTR